METIVNWIKSWTLDGKLSILVFIAFATLLLYASLKLVKYADIIIAKTKLGGAFIGGVFIAAITSTPELITEITQSASGNPGAGISDDLGSNAFSGLLIAIAAILFYKNRVFDNVDKWTKASIFISSGLAFIICICLLIGSDVQMGTPGTFVIGIIPMCFFLFYIYSLRLTYKYGDTDEVDEELSTKEKMVSVKTASWLFLVWGIAIIGLALVVNWTADAMMEGYDIPSSSIGGVFLAITTSLPEVVAFFALLRKKQAMAAIAALIGSHIFNVAMQFFGDMAYRSDSIYNVQEVQDVWPLALMTGLMMITLGMNALFAKKITKEWIRIAIPSLVISMYVGGWALIFAL